MKPFLLLQSRPEDAASNNEYEAVLHHGGLHSEQLVRIRVEQAPLPDIQLHDYSGVIVGGGPFNFTDAVKSEVQQRVENDLYRIARLSVDTDSPFFGMCYGVGLLTTLLGGRMSTDCSEPVGPATITIVADDPLLKGVKTPFVSLLGHKEGCIQLPHGATLLASSQTCRVQMFRLGRNVYATQFHPELDADGLATRVNVYKHHGYFSPDEADALIARGREANVIEPMKILKNFVQTYQR